MGPRSMRVLIIGRSRIGSDESGIYRALTRQGHTAVLVDDRKLAQWIGRRAANAWVRARVAAFRPDRVIVAKGHALEVQTLADLCRGRPSVMYYQDLDVPPLPKVVERARQVDSFFHLAACQLDEYERLGVHRARFLPSAACAWWDRPAEPSPAFASDVAFIGTGNDPYRVEFLLRLARSFRVKVWGSGWEAVSRDLEWGGREVHGRDFARVCASAKVVIGVNRSYQLSCWGYASSRLWRTVACGGLFLAPATPGMRELLRDGEHLAWYDGEDHACALLERYLVADEERERIRAAGRAFVGAHHTFDQRIHNLLSGEPFRNPLHAEAVTP